MRIGFQHLYYNFIKVRLCVCASLIPKIGHIFNQFFPFTYKSVMNMYLGENAKEIYF